MQVTPTTSIAVYLHQALTSDALQSTNAQHPLLQLLVCLNLKAREILLLLSL